MFKKERTITFNKSKTIKEEMSEGSNKDNDPTKLDESENSQRKNIFWTDDIVEEEKKLKEGCWYRFK